MVLHPSLMCYSQITFPSALYFYFVSDIWGRVLLTMFEVDPCLPAAPIHPPLPTFALKQVEPKQIGREQSIISAQTDFNFTCFFRPTQGCISVQQRQQKHFKSEKLPWNQNFGFSNRSRPRISVLDVFWFLSWSHVHRGKTEQKQVDPAKEHLATRSNTWVGCWANTKLGRDPDTERKDNLAKGKNSTWPKCSV